MRMGVFAILSEVPFDLARTGCWMDLEKQNVFITLFFRFMLYDHIPSI